MLAWPTMRFCQTTGLFWSAMEGIFTLIHFQRDGRTSRVAGGLQVARPLQGASSFVFNSMHWACKSSLQVPFGVTD
jgi:hypothetical protein